jgi:cytochrome c5
VSKNDDHFLNMFSIVLGVLMAIAIGIFIFARSVGIPFENNKAQADSMVEAHVAERLAPVGQVAVAGKDNSALTVSAKSAEPGPAMAGLPIPANGEATYKAVCSACHGAGVAGAPKVGDHSAWAARIAQGKSTLYEHALKGFQGKAGVMPMKGGRSDLPDALIKETIDYMVKSSQ